ncbi:MAG: rhomboid family intramembrane serine protease [Saprospiraceae bacterium]
MFPIGDDQVKGGYKPIFAYAIIVLNVLVFIFQVTLSPAQLEQFIGNYGTVPAQITQGHHLISLFSSMFLHGGWMHLIGNMTFLWVFGDNIEAVIGNLNFLLFYFIGGLAASAAHILAGPDSIVPAIGASGAIASVLGAYIVMFPASKIKILVIYFFSSFYIPAIFFLGIWIIQQLLNGFFSLGASATEDQSSGIAWWAHIGGFAFGLIAGIVARWSIEHRGPATNTGETV